MIQLASLVSILLCFCCLFGCTVETTGMDASVTGTLTTESTTHEISTSQNKYKQKQDSFKERAWNSSSRNNKRHESISIDVSDVPSDCVSLLNAIAEQYGCVGVQAAVIRDGAVRYHYEYGFADKTENRAVTQKTKYRCASLSKLIVAMVTMAIADATDFEIDNDISACFGYSVRNPDYPEIAITPRMLMTHTSSIIDSAAFLESRNACSSVPLRQLLERGSSYSDSKPGTYYVYSNFGLSVLAAGLEAYTGRYFDELAKEYLFSKHDLDCGFLAKDVSDPALVGTLYSSGGYVGYSVARQLEEYYCDEIGQTHHLYQGNLTISAVDYAKLLCVLLNGGIVNRKTILSSIGTEEMLKPQHSAGDHDCGLCVEILNTVLPERTMYCHTGSNFGMYSSFAFDKDAKNGVVVFTSGADAAIDSSGLYNVCADMIITCYKELL